MKKTIRNCAVLMALAMLVSLFAIGIGAASESDSYEIVLLLDTSGSMQSESDPTHISVDSARAFAYYRPSYTDMYVSLVAYNTTAYTVAESLNVSTDSGMNRYQEALDSIDDNTIGTFKCWKGMTNIGDAMQKAEAILSKSTATHKAVLLFTDGKTEVNSFSYKGNSYSGTEAVEKCIECAQTLATSFGSQGIRVYCAGLDTSGENLDRSFLESLSGVSKGTTAVCANATEVSTLFAKIFADFLGGQSGEKNDYDLLPNVETSHTANIYGQIIKEANISLISSSAISYFKVIAPDGTVAVEIGESSNTLNANLCSVDKTENNMLINVKLLRPMDGDWKVVMMSKTAGKVTLNQVYLYDLSLDCTIPTRVGAGEELSFAAKFINDESSSAITNKRIYSDSTMSVKITDLNAGTTKTLTGSLDSSGLAFNFKQAMDTCGKFKIECTIENPQIKKSHEATVEVLPAVPVLSSSPASVCIGESATLKLSFKSALTGKTLTSLPSYLKDFTASIDVLKDGVKIETISLSAKNFSNGAVTHTYTPDSAGNYTFDANLKEQNGTLHSVETAGSGFGATLSYSIGVTAPSGDVNCKDGAKISVILKNSNGDPIAVLPESYANVQVTISIFSGDSVVDTATLTAADFVGGTVDYVFKPKAAGSYTVATTVLNDGETTEAERVSLSIVNSQISLSDNKPSGIKESNFEGTADKTIDFSGLFTNSDGDALTYTVKVSDPDAVTATIEGTTLKISVSKFTKGTVTIVATDAYGASASHELNVTVKSAVGGLIVWIIVAIVLVIGLVVLFIVLRKRMIISTAFDVKITSNESYDSVVYSIAKLSKKKYAKPTMTLSEILNSNAADIVSGDLNASDFIDSDASKISLTGLIKGRGFKIAIQGKPSKRTFSGRSQTSVSVGDYSVAFGRVGTFSDEY